MKKGFSTSLFVLAGIFLLSVSCDDDKTSLPEGGEGVNEFPVTLTEADYTPDNTYYLLKRTKAPTIIVECGFLSNWEEAKKLQEDSYQNQIAWAVSMGILSYLGEENQ